MEPTRGHRPAHRRITRLSTAVAVALGATAGVAAATVSPATGADEPFVSSSSIFRHTATFDVMAGNGSSVAEIVDTDASGTQVVYTDADNEQIGFVDISDPHAPIGAGVVNVGGEPTALVIRGNLVYVGVNTSPSFVEPSGELVIVGRFNRQIIKRIDLGGQPDSIALSPDQDWMAVVIENERDEDLDDGLLPQAPSGGLVVFDLRNSATSPRHFPADLSPVMADAFAGSDLEPEFVDINDRNQAVVSFQENNHLAVVNLYNGQTTSSFSAGEVELSDVDTAEEDLISLDSDIVKRREPDSVAWIDRNHFATANEGDYEDANGEEGGSRGFTIFHRDGTVVFESAESFEHLLVSAGHYNEGRSENKGVEPEAVEVGTYAGRTVLFVGSERSNAVGVYDVADPASPELIQVLPTGIGPEGLKAIGTRGLLVVATESDVADVGIPTMINVFQTSRPPVGYPQIVSADDADGLPIPWVALSGLAGDPTDAGTIYAVSDSFLAAGFVYTVDVTTTPATIVDRTEVIGASTDLDLEGVAVGPDGYWWLGSEGNSSSRPNLVLQVDPATGAVMSEIELPADLVDQRRGNGIEGISVVGEAGADVVYVAIQRAWPDEGDSDEVNTKIGRYDTATGTWGFVHYPLEAEGNGDWIGLSELTALPDGSFAVIERDKGWGPSTGFVAELKAVFGIDLAGAEFRAFDDPNGLVTIDKTLLRDMLGDIEGASIWTAEKLEGLAVAADGAVYTVTDNDGVDDATGETVFLGLGHWSDALGG